MFQVIKREDENPEPLAERIFQALSLDPVFADKGVQTHCLINCPDKQGTLSGVVQALMTLNASQANANVFANLIVLETSIEVKEQIGILDGQGVSLVITD